MSKKKAIIIDYEKLRQTAYKFVVEQGLTQKEVANRLGVSEVTMSDWAREGNWRNERKMRQSSSKTAKSNINRIIEILSSKRLALEEKINLAEDAGDKDKELELRKKANSISDEISKQNTYLKNITKENHITLGVYVDVTDDNFNLLREYDEELYNKTLDFQTWLIRKKSQELG